MFKNDLINNISVKNFIFLSVISILIVFSSFLWQGHVGFNLADEGYLWYGAQRVLQGEVPIRDFMAYDPGRYYWLAGFMSLVGDSGIISLRVAVSIFQGLGLFTGLYILSRAIPITKKNIWYLGVSAVIIMLWGYPRHKLFDITLSVAIIANLVYLIELPTNRRCFMGGIFVGMVAVFGRNHGIYAAIASIGVIAYLHIESNPVPFLCSLLSWGMGVIIGFSPILFLFITQLGFASAFLDSIVFLFQYKGTNLPLQVPWPWLVPFSQMDIFSYLRDFTIGFFFIAILVFALLSPVYVVLKRIRGFQVSPLLISSAFISLPYVHFAYSRSDVGHLAQGITPFLIGILFILSQCSRYTKIIGNVTMLMASFLVMLPLHPGYQSAMTHNWVPMEIAGDALIIEPYSASNLILLKQLDHEYSPNDGQFLVVPFWPGAYAALERKAPIWEIYPLFPRSNIFQEGEIERIRQANPGFVLILDFPLDGRDDLRYKNTHPLINKYIQENFVLLSDKTQDKSLQIYKRKTIG